MYRHIFISELIVFWISVTTLYILDYIFILRVSDHLVTSHRPDHDTLQKTKTKLEDKDQNAPHTFNPAPHASIILFGKHKPRNTRGMLCLAAALVVLATSPLATAPLNWDFMTLHPHPIGRPSDLYLADSSARNDVFSSNWSPSWVAKNRSKGTS